ncbi:hypothetical protein [Bradyrhizobium prioriisuperbiae]|uniref:COG3904 family protein n=1 Tax=Bradyrhizobium prioriisuperbiae TaxID=2854389 RepID=UPI0028EBFE40|nr:hypothetical protein [Bradyrhizobium prioritasuperba]
MSSENNPNEPARPWGAPRPDQSQPPAPRTAGRIPLLSILFFVLMLVLVGARAYRDLSTPQAWAYWKDQFISPSLSASIVRGSPDQRPALAIHGRIGPAAAGWFRDRLDEAKLRPGDSVVFSSPGGDVDQAIIIGEVIRARGLTTAVGTFDADDRLRPSYCASACVFAYAGGKVRQGVQGSRLGVHRFTTEGAGRDAVADTQRTAGLILGYMTRMGVSPSLVEAMSATDEIRWLDAREALDMRLVTDPQQRR